jgi:lysophospholipase L1-like esterase
MRFSGSDGDSWMVGNSSPRHESTDSDPAADQSAYGRILIGTPPVGGSMKRLLIFLVALAATLSLSLAGSPTAQARPAHSTPTVAVVNYVALGDSYSAGVGNAPYDPESGICLRSAKAYSVLLAAWSHKLNVDSNSFKACDGATTATLIAKQLPAEPNTDIQTVTVTIGGNDVDTFALLPDCMGLTDGVPGCSETEKAVVTSDLEVLPGSMHLALAGIHAAYPNARIYVGSYMELFGTRKTDCKVGELNGQSFYVTYADKVWLNTMARKLNAKIKKAVHRADNAMRVTYVDVAAIFNGHGLCDFARPWVGHLDATNLKSLLHPTARGQQAYAVMFHTYGVGR